MPPVDPYAPVPANPYANLTPAEVYASPTTGIMKAAADKHQRDLQAWQQEQDLRNAQEVRAKQSATLAAAHDTHIATQDQNAGLQRTMAGDMAISRPAYKDASGRIPQWDDLPPEAPQSYADRYGVDAMANARATWDSGIPVQNRVLVGQLTKAGKQIPPGATNEELQSLAADTASDQQAAKEAAVKAKQEGADQKTSSAQEMAQQRILTQVLRSAQNNQQVKGYQSARTNFDSVQRNVSNPVRSGADDVFLLQAAATMENPTRSTTAADIKEFMQARGIKGNLNTMADRYGALINQSPDAQARQGRILDDNTVRQIAASAQRSVQARRESLTEIMTPFVNRMEDLGMDPYRHFPKELVDDVYGVSQQPQQPPQGQPANLPPAANPQAPQAPAVPPTAIQHLQQHPELAPYFDQKYGRGSSAHYLTPTQ